MGDCADVLGGELVLGDPVNTLPRTCDGFSVGAEISDVPLEEAVGPLSEIDEPEQEDANGWTTAPGAHACQIYFPEAPACHIDLTTEPRAHACQSELSTESGAHACQGELFGAHLPE